MKELTIEEKAKRYDGAIIRGSRLWESDMITRENYEYIFPEVKESKDARIRQFLLRFVEYYIPDNYSDDFSKEDCLAWLERQGEQKTAYTKEYDFHGMKFIPKFAKGDIIKDKKRGEVSTIEDFSYDTGLYTHTYGQFPITIQDNYEIIEQKPADKKGMNLVEEEMTPFQKEVFCIIDTTIEKEQGLKQVCDKLFALASKEIKQKPVWSEEDESRIDNLCHFLEEYGNQYYGCLTLQGTIAWLKSLRHQLQWKPSDLQLECLSDAIKCYNSQGYPASTLKGLLDELSKLK